MELKNKNILITGGAIRVGRAISLELLNSGANIFCHYNTSVESAKSLQKLSSKIHLLQYDLSKIANLEMLVEQAASKAGTIDALINNASIFFKTPFGTVSEKQWDDLFLINLKSPFFLAQKVGKLMLEQGWGKIINIGDTNGLNPWPSFIPYSLTKSGIISMTKGLAKALAPKVQVNCINPGPVMLPENYTKHEKEIAIKNTLLKREGNAEDIAKTVRFLLEDSDYITGSIINVDGGRSVK